MMVKRQYATESARQICEELLPEWRDQFLLKNEDYGDYHDTLGEKGQFADIWRKLFKLKRSMWDEETMNGEDTDEILQDLIGHCFLALQLRRGTDND